MLGADVVCSAGDCCGPLLPRVSPDLKRHGCTADVAAAQGWRGRSACRRTATCLSTSEPVLA